MDRFRVVRELGSRAEPTWAALDSTPAGAARLVVLDRMPLADAAAGGDPARVSRAFATLEHANVVRVRDAIVGPRDVLVASDFVDGVLWSDLMRSSPRPALEVALRVFVDVLSGLWAIHNLRDARRQPLRLVHGALSADTVVVGLDGVTKIARAYRGTPAAVSLGAKVTRATPEAAAGDPRADVYSVGLLLWEALGGRVPAEANAARRGVGGSAVMSWQRPVLPAEQRWAEPLIDAAARALAPDPVQRFASAAAMAAELRRVAGPKMAPSARVASVVNAAHGDRIRARRAALEDGRAQAPSSAPMEIEDLASTVPPRHEPPPQRRPPPVPQPALESHRGGPPAADEHAAITPLHPSRELPRAAISTSSPAAAPVVESSMPPPLAPIVVPAVPPLPRDLFDSLTGPISDAPPAPPFPVDDARVPAPTAEVPSSAPVVAPRRRLARRSAAVILIAIVSTVVLVGLVRSLASRAPEPKIAAPKVHATAPAATLAQVPVPHDEPKAAPVASTVASVASPPPTTEPPASEPAQPAAGATAVDPAGGPASPAEAAPAPPSSRRTSHSKYDPEGI